MKHNISTKVFRLMDSIETLAKTVDEQQRAANGQFGSGGGSSKKPAARREALAAASKGASPKSPGAGQRLGQKLNSNAAANAGSSPIAGTKLLKAREAGTNASVYGTSLENLKNTMRERGHSKEEINHAEKAYHEQEARG